MCGELSGLGPRQVRFENGGDEAFVRKDAEICYLRHGEADDDETFGVHGEVEAGEVCEWR